MVSRSTYSGGSTPPLTGVDFLNQYAERLDTLFDASELPLTAVGGTANAVTATLDPALTGALVDGMKFNIIWAATNTTGVTLALNGAAAVSVLDASGAALVPGALVSGLMASLIFTGGAFRILSAGADAGAGLGPQVQTFTASGTWTKPAGYDPDHPVLVRLWGGGGSGARNTGINTCGSGGGGAYSERFFRMADLPSSVAVSIGAGGAARSTTQNGANGGDTTFGTLLTAYGGGGGLTTGGSGGGGGMLSAANLGASGTFGPAPSGFPNAGGAAGVAGSPGVVGQHSVYGGGGAGGCSATVAAAGGVSLYGGNGGAGVLAGVAGNAGAVRGGGGSGSTTTSGAGGRGEAEIWVM
jgi:hypothetical protein